MSTVDPAASSTATNKVANAAATSLSNNYTMFLKLLTTQLQNQDPLSPTDSTTFTQQLVQYSQVEQQIKTNDNLTSLIDTTKTNGNANIALLNYLDKYVEVSGTNFPLQKSQATMAYQLASAANKVTLDILDTSGAKVATFDGPTGAGLQKISWDGKDAKGKQYSDGRYTLQITATDASGKAIAVNKQSLIGHVTGIERTATGNLLNLGNLQVKEADIVNVYQSPNDKVS
jgi:flagellar basal-body rod modification protein FlgD